MRRILFVAVVFTLIASAAVFAQQRKGGFSLGLSGGQLMGLSDTDIDEQTYVLDLRYMFADLWSVELRYGILDVDNGDAGYYNLDMLYHFHPERKAVPYLVLGAGTASFEPDFGEDDDGLIINFGAGFDYSFNDTLSLRGDTRYVSSDLDYLDSGVQFTLGVGFQFGGEPRPVPQAVESVDRDMDGVPDSIDYCWETPPRVRVDSKGCPIDSDGDGTPDYLEDDDNDTVINYDDQCPDTQEGFAVDAVGCPIDSDNDGITDGKERELGTDPYKSDTDGDGLTDGDEINKYHTDPLNPDTDGDGLTDGDEVLKYKSNPLKADSDDDGLEDGVEVLRFETDPTSADDVFDWLINSQMINFDFDKADIREDAHPVLDDIATLMTGSRTLRVLIKGHCDNVGPRWYNDKLSIKRAVSAKEYLISKGVPGERIDTTGFGEDKPVADNKTEEGRDQNRRDEFEVVK